MSVASVYNVVNDWDSLPMVGEELDSLRGTFEDISIVLLKTSIYLEISVKLKIRKIMSNIQQFIK